MAPVSDMDAMAMRAEREARSNGQLSGGDQVGDKRKGFVRATGEGTASAGGTADPDAVKAIDAQAAKIRATLPSEGGPVVGVRVRATNPEELAIDETEGEDGEDEPGLGIVRRPVPAAVFGSAAANIGVSSSSDGGDTSKSVAGAKVGALERLRG